MDTTAVLCWVLNCWLCIGTATDYMQELGWRDIAVKRARGLHADGRDCCFEKRGYHDGAVCRFLWLLFGLTIMPLKDTRIARQLIDSASSKDARFFLLQKS